jgi:flagellin
MTSVINTNIASLGAQRNLSTSQSSLATSIQRLSSGLRINSAKDDAAGLAISSRMTSQINGMDQATRNANDGVSMAQTADGALSSSSDILQRVRQLAVQSSNASNTSSDRAALQNEVTQMGSELNRIAQTTQFNGQSLLDGTMGTANFQVGANAGQLISMTGANFTTSAYGDNNMSIAAPVAAATSNTTAAGTITINGSAGSTAVTVGAGDSAKTVASNINALTGSTDVTASAKTDALFTAVGGESYTMDLSSDNATAQKVSFSIGGAGTKAEDYAEAISAFNAQTSKTGVTASFDTQAAGGGIKLTNASGNDIKLANNSTNATATATLATYDTATPPVATASQPLATGGGTAVAMGQIKLDSDKSFSTVDSGTGYAQTGNSSLKAVSTIDISTFDGAQLAIKIADAALSSVNGQRAQYGAIQNRFDSTIANLGTTNTNLQSSRSRITDTDFASETANMTRSQILQQAGTSMLAQANSLPNGVLSLLRG